VDLYTEPGERATTKRGRETPPGGRHTSQNRTDGRKKKVTGKFTRFDPENRNKDKRQKHDNQQKKGNPGDGGKKKDVHNTVREKKANKAKKVRKGKILGGKEERPVGKSKKGKGEKKHDVTTKKSEAGKVSIGGSWGHTIIASQAKSGIHQETSAHPMVRQDGGEGVM